VRGRRRLAFLVVPFLLVGVVNVVQASAAPANTAAIAAPTCGKDVSITLTTTKTSRVRFAVERTARTGVAVDTYLQGPRTTTLKLALTGTETIKVTADNTVIATKAVSPSATPCRTNLPAPAGSISMSIVAPTCGSIVGVTANNPTSSTNWFEVWRSGRTAADVTYAVARNQVAQVTTDIGTTAQTVKGVWGSKTLAQSKVSPKAPCAGTTTTTSTTSTTVKPTTTTTSTTVPPTTTTTSTTVPPTTTTTLPPCTSADRLSAWGCPVRVDNFDTLNTATGWTVYSDPTGYAPRSPANVRVRNGELQLVGTYDQSTGTIMSAGMNDKFAQQYGRWETRVKVDNGAGYSAVALLWPHQGVWPTDGEIDIFENPKSPRVREMSVVHNGPNNSAQSVWTNVDMTQWHTYAVEWTPSSVTFFVDNVRTLKVTRSDLVPDTSRMHMTLQFDARRPTDNCNGWYQCPDRSTPAETIMHVDYVKAWAYTG
jgi:beta-glucanase (GH16 family)